MVVKLIRWPSWPPFHSEKFEVIIVIQQLEGLRLAQFEGGNMLACEIKWKGPKGIALGSLRRSMLYLESIEICFRGNYSKPTCDLA